MAKGLDKKGIAAYAIGFFLLFAIFFFVLHKGDYREVLAQISVYQVCVAIFMTFGLFFINGCIIAFMTSHQYKTSIGLWDTALLPFMMHFWSYIIPFRGGLLFSAFFLKLKYNIKGAESIAIGVLTIMVSLVITGLCGVYFTVAHHMIYSVWTLLSLLLALTPSVILLVDSVMKRIQINGHAWLDRLKTFIASVTVHSRKLMMDRTISAGIFLITAAGIVLYVIFIFWVAQAMHIAASLEMIVVFALMMRLSVFVRIVPGNIGVQELFSGGTFYMVGGDMTDGLAIALFVRFFSLLLTFSLGMLGIVVNMQYFNIRNIRKLWAELRDYRAV